MKPAPGGTLHRRRTLLSFEKRIQILPMETIRLRKYISSQNFPAAIRKTIAVFVEMSELSATIWLRFWG
jgi:hypothetical protein